MEHFHNTIGLKGEELNQANQAGKTQEDIITQIFTKAYNGLTASEVHKQFPSLQTPITSIRRAMTNLSTQGKLNKTSSMKPGIYGKPEHIYSKVSQVEKCSGCQNCNCKKQD